MRRRAWLAAIPATIFAGLGAAAFGGVRVNTTASMPVGLYHVNEGGEIKPRRGDVVTACIPPWPNIIVMAGDCPFGSAPFVKPVGAVPGDIVRIAPEGVSVNGQRVTGPAQPPESFAQPVPRMPNALYRVQEGEVWLLSDHHERSFDSRFYGPVRIAWLRGLAKPLLVAR